LVKKNKKGVFAYRSGGKGQLTKEKKRVTERGGAEPAEKSAGRDRAKNGAKAKSCSGRVAQWTRGKRTPVRGGGAKNQRAERGEKKAKSNRET